MSVTTTTTTTPTEAELMAQLPKHIAWWLLTRTMNGLDRSNTSSSKEF